MQRRVTAAIRCVDIHTMREHEFHDFLVARLSGPDQGNVSRIAADIQIGVMPDQMLCKVRPLALESQ